MAFGVTRVERHRPVAARQGLVEPALAPERGGKIGNVKRILRIAPDRLTDQRGRDIVLDAFK